MADQNLTELTAQTTWSADDLVYVVDDPAGTPADKKMTLDDLFTEIVTGVVVKTTNGIDVTPGSDTDCDLLTVNVTGTPKLSWAEAQNQMEVTGNLSVSGKVAVGADVNGDYVLYVGSAQAKADCRGLNVDFTNTGAATSGMQLYPRTTGTGNLTTLYGEWVRPNHGSTGTLDNIYCIYTLPSNGGGTVSNCRHILIGNASGAGDITNQYGIQILALSKGTSVNWAFHNASSPMHTEGYFEFENSSEPTGGVTDSFQMYAADAAAGDSAPHFKTESGDIVKLYQQALLADPTDLAELVTWAANINTYLKNLGLMASA